MSDRDRRGLAAGTSRALLAALVAFPLAGHAATAILPLGDSITEGTAVHPFRSADYPESAYRNDPGGPPANLASYREHLHDLLTHESCGADIEWVGARRASGRVPEVHEGHGGWHASYFDEIRWRDANGRHEGERDLPGWLPLLAPDVVTLHLGTNGLGRSRSAAQNVDDIEDILDDVFEARPSARVYLANVIPIAGWWGDRATTLPDSRPTVREEAQVLTGLIGNLAAEQSAVGRRVVLVDVNSEFYLDESNPVSCPAATGGDPENMAMTVCVPDPVAGDGSTIPDGLHPGLKGDRFVAERFFRAMREAGGLCAGDPVTAPDAPDAGNGSGNGDGNPEPAPEPGSEEGNGGADPDVPTDPEAPIVMPAPDPSTGGDGAAPDESGADAPDVDAFVELLTNWRHARPNR